MSSRNVLLRAFLVLICNARHVAAQSPAEEADAHLAKARSLAGMQFITTEEVQCRELGVWDPYRRAMEKPEKATPTQVFDNLYYIGRKELGAWAIKTADGIILIDAMHTDDESTLTSGLKKLKLDPADVRYVVVTRAEGDAYGGARFFQAKYGAQVIMSAADWDYVDRTSGVRGGRGGRGDTLGTGRRGGSGGGGGGGLGGRGGGGRGGFGGGRGGGGGGGFGGGRSGNGRETAAKEAVENPPRREQVAVDGQTYTLGAETITIVATPGTTPGSLSVLVPVTDHGAHHMVAILGGTASPALATMKNTFITSAQHLGTVAAAAHVEGELNSYPFVDNGIARMDSLRKEHPGTANANNPFLIGEDGFQRYIGVIAECGWVSLLKPGQGPN